MSVLRAWETAPVKALFDTVHVHCNLSSVRAARVEQKPLWKRATLPEKKPGLLCFQSSINGRKLYWHQFWHHNGEHSWIKSCWRWHRGRGMEEFCHWSSDLHNVCASNDHQMYRRPSLLPILQFKGEFVSFVTAVFAGKETHKCKSNAEKQEKDTKVNC